jgi:hypothetical protein
MFLWMVDRIDDRFDVADNRNREIAKDIGGIREDNARQTAGIEMILKRMDYDDAQRGPREGQSEPVHQGTRR